MGEGVVGGCGCRAVVAALSLVPGERRRGVGGGSGWWVVGWSVGVCASGAWHV